MLRIHKMTGHKAFKWQIACKLWTKAAPAPPRPSKHRSGVCLGVSRGITFNNFLISSSTNRLVSGLSLSSSPMHSGPSWTGQGTLEYPPRCTSHCNASFAGQTQAQTHTLTSSLIAYLVTMARAILVATSTSLLAPVEMRMGIKYKSETVYTPIHFPIKACYVALNSCQPSLRPPPPAPQPHSPLVMLSFPKTSSSATLPPMATSRRASNCFLLQSSSSFSGSWETCTVETGIHAATPCSVGRTHTGASHRKRTHTHNHTTHHSKCTSSRDNGGFVDGKGTLEKMRRDMSGAGHHNTPHCTH